MKALDVTLALMDAVRDVHETWGPGWTRGMYADFLAEALEARGLELEPMEPEHTSFRGRGITFHYKIDVIAIALANPRMRSLGRLVTYLQLPGPRPGLLIDFNTSTPDSSDPRTSR